VQKKKKKRRGEGWIITKDCEKPGGNERRDPKRSGVKKMKKKQGGEKIVGWLGGAFGLDKL